MSTTLKLTDGEKRMFAGWLNAKLASGIKLKQAREECWKAMIFYRAHRNWPKAKRV
jgi:hypothetical protein